jgi:dephospho-CoA kinase
MRSEKKYIGVVGQIACGKGELKDYLVEELGFTSFSLSSIVHEELRKNGVTEFTRKALQDMGDELRKKYGDAVLAKLTINKVKDPKSKIKDLIVIEGIRNPGEIEFLKKLPHFVLIGVKAKRELRFKRLLKRNKEWDPKVWNDFLIVDRRDLGVGQKKSGQQVGKCLHYCDYILTNNRDVRDFQRKVKNLMEKVFRR